MLALQRTELELFGLLINVSAFKHLIKGVEFDAYVDHSPILDILKSKHEPPTSRVERLLFKLSEYTFKIGYKKRSEMVLADYLSRAPLSDDSEIDRVLPIAFIASSPVTYIDESQEQVLCPIVTRSVAKAQGIEVPEIFSPRKRTDDDSDSDSDEV